MDQSAKNKDSLGNDIVETVGSVLGELTGVPGGGEVGKLISRYGKKLIDYSWDQERGFEVDSPDRLILVPGAGVGPPPFIVVGLGRCGCHVTAELAEIIASAAAESDKKAQSHKRRSWLNQLFRTSKSGQVLKFEPIMLVGDIDETAFQDVDGLLSKGGVPHEFASRVLKLNYRPLDSGGTGHVPLLAEFLTRGLLLLPSKNKKNETASWLEAKSFLMNFFSRFPQASRLVFYIFSTAGGTGAGSAAEIMKAQRYAMSVSEDSTQQIYFTGVAILPQNISKDHRHLINTGRTIVQYLADLNIVLDDNTAYDQAPVLKTSAIVKHGDKETQLMPWDGMALISNDVMSAISLGTATLEEVESNTNQYIAQQMFNLAAAQFSAASFEIDENVAITKENYQSIRLDPKDLKTGLLGPYGICFSAANSQELLNEAGLDRMFLRALGMPKYHESLKRENALNLIEGISVAPYDKNKYAELLHGISERISDKTKDGALILEHEFEELRKIPVFERCPRTVFVFTAPQDGTIPAIIKERLTTLLHWLLPNLDQVRGAIVRGTTAYYTLSIYIESSVLLSPDVQIAVKNYIKFCWGQRKTSPDEFKKKYNEIIDQDPPISDEQIIKWLGEKEKYGINIPNFDGLVNELNARWLAYVSKNSGDPKLKEKLLGHKVESAYLKPSEVASALRFINYTNHLEQPEIVT
jgi:hypothetical protein